MDNTHSPTHENTATSASASIALRRTSIPNINIAVTRPNREPLALLDPQSAHSRLCEDPVHSTSSIHTYSQQQSDASDRDFSLDLSSYRIGRPILTHPTRSDEDHCSESVVSSRKSSTTQAPSGLQQTRHAIPRPMQSSPPSSRRASVPAIHFRASSGSFGAGSSTTMTNTPVQNPNYINNDELYSGLTTFTFGAARATRSSTPDSEMLDPFPNRTIDQRPRRSLSAVSTPRDDDIDDEDDVARSSRAKMRAIDDGSRRPSLPKNSPSVSRRHHIHSQQVMDMNTVGDVKMDIDRVSTHTFGHPGLGQYNDEEQFSMVSSSPVIFANSQHSLADEEDDRLYVLHVGSDQRRGSIPVDIPTPVTWTDSDNSIRAGRKMSRSMDDDIRISNIGIGGMIGISDTGPNAYSEPRTKGEWSSFEQQRKPSLAHEQENVYGGLDLAYILGSNPSATVPRQSWSSGGSFVQHQPVLHSPHHSFSLWFKGGADSRRPSAATIGEDTFLKHIEVNDAYYKTRLKDWTFGKEKADGSGMNTVHTPGGGVRDPTSLGTIGPGTHEIWRCQVVGRFAVERHIISSEPESFKQPQHRLNVKHIVDPFSENKRGGPSVLVHKHSRATAFSIFRSHDLFKSHHNTKFGGRMDTSHSILLGTRKVQEMYTSTRTTSRLETHGLLEKTSKDEDKNSDKTSSRKSTSDVSHRPRTQSTARKEREKKDKEKEKEKDRDKEKEKEKERKRDKIRGKERSRDTSQTTSRDSTYSNQDKLKHDGLMSSWTRHLSGRHVSPPPMQPAPPPSPSVMHVPSLSSSSQASKATSLTDSPTWRASESSLDLAGTSQSHQQLLHHSSSRPTLRDIAGDDFDDLDEYHLPPQRRSYAETYDSLTPMHHEHARRLMASNPGATSSSRARFRIFPTKKGGSGVEWPSQGTSIVPSPVPWMLTKPPEKVEEGQVVMSNLNDNFGAVGLVPPRHSSRSHHRHRKARGEENLLLQVPEDSLYMVIPLFAGETDAEHTPALSDSSFEIPLENRKYLLVYYVPFDQRTNHSTASGKQGTGSLTGATSQDLNKNKSVFLSSFRVSTHLMSYNDFRESGVRLPSLGLSVTGPLSKATPPTVVPDVHMDAIAIAQCSKREKGIEFLPEGLHKLGLCFSEEVRQPPDVEVDGDDEVEFRFELSAIGRAVVELAWVGAMAVTSFGSV